MDSARQSAHFRRNNSTTVDDRERKKKADHLMGILVGSLGVAGMFAGGAFNSSIEDARIFWIIAGAVGGLVVGAVGGLVVAAAVGVIAGIRVGSKEDSLY